MTSDNEIKLTGCTGDLEIRNYTTGGDNRVDMIGGKIALASSCTGGTMVIGGTCAKDDQSAVGMVVTDQRDNKQERDHMAKKQSFIGHAELKELMGAIRFSRCLQEPLLGRCIMPVVRDF